jgi:type VI protein secretion system component VasK
MTLKLVTFWVFGGILISAAAWILGHASEAVGVSEIGYVMAVFLAFVMILIGGLAWINVAAAMSKH